MTQRRARPLAVERLRAPTHRHRNSAAEWKGSIYVLRVRHRYAQLRTVVVNDEAQKISLLRNPTDPKGFSCRNVDGVIYASGNPQIGARVISHGDVYAGTTHNGKRGQ